MASYKDARSFADKNLKLHGQIIKGQTFDSAQQSHAAMMEQVGGTLLMSSKQEDTEHGVDAHWGVPLAYRVRDVASCGEHRDVSLRLTDRRGRRAEYHKMKAGKIKAVIYVFAWTTKTFKAGRLPHYPLETAVLHIPSLAEHLGLFKLKIQNTDGKSSAVYCPLSVLLSEAPEVVIGHEVYDIPINPVSSVLHCVQTVGHEPMPLCFTCPRYAEMMPNYFKAKRCH